MRATPDATVADLARRLGGTTCAVDGVRVDPRRRLRDWVVLRGSEITVVDVDSPIGPTATADPSWRCAVIGGPDAGPSVPLPTAGQLWVGRDPDAGCSIDDPTVSVRHLLFDGLEVEDTESTNGTLIGGMPLPAGRTSIRPGEPITIGATTIAVRPVDLGPSVPLPPPTSNDGPPVAGAWVQAFHRPVAPDASTEADPIHLPASAASPTGSTPIGVVALIVPIVLGGVMVAVLHDVLWGLFALLGPVMAVGTWWDQRRRGRRLGRRAARIRDARLASCRRTLGASVAAERAHRLREQPDLAFTADQVATPGPALWHRRTGDTSFLRVRIGTGDLPWHPPIANPEVLVHPDDDRFDPAVAELIDDASTLPGVPATVSFAPGSVVAIVGSRSMTRRYARAMLIHLAAWHGPADLDLAVETFDARDEWRWVDWLPHPIDVTTRGVLVLDGPELWTGADPRHRRRLSDRSSPIGILVLADHPEEVPAATTTVVEVIDQVGTAHLSGCDVLPGTGPIRLDGCSVAFASDTARHLARLADPERLTPPGADGAVVRLADPWHPGHVCFGGSPAALAERWGADPDPAPQAVIGVGPDGPFTLDLDADGPHVLIAGTTGSGKSELLRTLVVGLAIGAPPSALQVLLVDFKGGSAFDRLADLPHTVGVVTDLSPTEVGRMVRALDAEVRRRERLLRASGSVDLGDHRAQGTGPDLARLIVVVDEFATLARDHPDALDALLSIAQRGRSLGMHLVLSTQRPAGVVSEAVRANLSARLALRLPREADSIDVINSPEAACLPRNGAGRAIAALGTEPLVHLQVATTAVPHPSGTPPPVEVVADPPLADTESDGCARPCDGTDLDAHVDLIMAAHHRTGAVTPAPVCLPSLPNDLAIDDLAPGSFGLVDDPDHQRQFELAWRTPGGPFLFVGPPGSGRSTALAAMADSRCRVDGPHELHAYAIDGGHRRLADLADRPQFGDVVGAGDLARHERLVRMLGDELRRRREGLASGGPHLLLVVDDLGPLLDRWDDLVIDRFGELVVSGGAFGCTVAMAVDRVAAIPAAWQAAITRRVELHADGRGVVASDGLAIQIAAPTAHPDDRRRVAPPVRLLPEWVRPSDLVDRPADADGWWLPVGVADDTLTPTGWTLHDDDHVLITGPPGSGRSSVLHALAEVLALDDAADLMTVDGRTKGRSAGAWQQALVPAADVVRRIEASDGRRIFVLIDDADRLPDHAFGLRTLVADGTPALHLVTATSAEHARRGFSHVTREVRGRGLGLLLAPDPDIDGELFSVRLPRRVPIGMRPGRGYLISAGRARLIQGASMKHMESH